MSIDPLKNVAFDVCSILENLSEPVIAVDSTETILFMNKAAATLTEWQKEEAIGQVVSDIISIENPHQANVLRDFILQTTSVRLTLKSISVSDYKNNN